jgi:hypothetical protein
MYYDGNIHPSDMTMLPAWRKLGRLGPIGWDLTLSDDALCGWKGCNVNVCANSYNLAHAGLEMIKCLKATHADRVLNVIAMVVVGVILGFATIGVMHYFQKNRS